MEALRQIQKRYDQYGKELAGVYKKASPFAGVFGLGNDPKNHPCNMAFYEDVGALVADFAASGPDKEQLLAVTRWILEAPVGRDKENVYWFLFACHKHTLPLIPLLDAADCEVLYQWYNKTFPPRKRLPLQDEVYQLLKKQAQRR